MLVVGAAAAAEEDDGARRAREEAAKKSRKRRQADEEDEEDSDDDDEPPPEELAGGALARAMVRAAALAYGRSTVRAGAGDDGSERLAAYLRDGVGPALLGLAGVADAADLARSPRWARPSPAATSERRLALARRCGAAADSEDAVLDVAARVCAADVDGDGVAKCPRRAALALAPAGRAGRRGRGPRSAAGRRPRRSRGLPGRGARGRRGDPRRRRRCGPALPRGSPSRSAIPLHAAVKYARAAALAGNAGATLDAVALVETEAALAVAKFERDLDGGFTAADVDERLARDFGALLTGATAHAEAALAEPPAPASPSGGGLFADDAALARWHAPVAVPLPPSSSRRRPPRRPRSSARRSRPRATSCAGAGPR
ncbi:hypothetical protein JL721_9611 [Aureococcus anophagefferens]|nr:hypothetical protein JL721_9611 [Aureococcus anophagefferens]